MTTERFRRKNVVITGGSSGIGLEIAGRFAGLGAQVWLLARSTDRLNQAVQTLRTEYGGQISVFSIAVDVTDEAAVTGAMNEIGEKHGGIHTLINNAGTMICGRFEDNSPEELAKVMDVNYGGMVNALKAAWPYLIHSGDGHIGFVSSVAGYLGAIGYSGYAPSKFAVTGLAECLRMEAAEYGLGVTIVFPPDTDTPMLAFEHENTLPESRALSKNASVLQPAHVATRFVEGIIRNHFEVFCNIESRFIRLVKIVWPTLYFRIMDRIVEKDKRQRARA